MIYVAKSLLKGLGMCKGFSPYLCFTWSTCEYHELIERLTNT